jgi:8-oxo-dGTP pyrophosphatase MutT (NUDIX family)
MTEIVRRESTRVAVIDADDRVLLLHTWDPGRAGSEVWELPGGGLEDGEVPTDGARRELYEETGIAAAELGPRLGVVETEFVFDGRCFRQRETIFSLAVERAEYAPAGLAPGTERSAHLGHEWVPIDDLRARGLRLYPPQLLTLLVRAKRDG